MYLYICSPLIFPCLFRLTRQGSLVRSQPRPPGITKGQGSVPDPLSFRSCRPRSIVTGPEARSRFKGFVSIRRGGLPGPGRESKPAVTSSFIPRINALTEPCGIGLRRAGGVPFGPSALPHHPPPFHPPGWSPPGPSTAGRVSCPPVRGCRAVRPLRPQATE